MASEMNVRRFRALSDPTRLRVVEFLSACCCGSAAVREDGGIEGPTAGEVCCSITGAEKITSTVSHHLHELEGAGLLKITRRGKTMICTLEPDALLGLSEFLSNLAKGQVQDGGCELPQVEKI